jgi:hypothetical protein
LRTSRSSEEGAGSERTTEQHPAGAGERRPPGRLRALARNLDPDQRLAAAAAAALGASIFLPWWRDPIFGITYVGLRRLTFLEVGIFVVALAVLVLLLRRAEGKFFRLPLSDGTLIAAAGAWTGFLVVFRMLDPPTRTVGGTTHDYGLRWGIVFALASSVVLAAAGVRTRRRHHRGQPESVAADADATAALPLI